MLFNPSANAALKTSDLIRFELTRKVPLPTPDHREFVLHTCTLTRRCHCEELAAGSCKENTRDMPAGTRDGFCRPALSVIRLGVYTLFGKGIPSRHD
jgi:hypothetical protein